MSKSDLLRSSSFLAILKALFNLSLLVNFQSYRMIGTVFIGLQRSMMVFFGKKHHLGIFFLSLPNNVCLTSKLYRMHKNKFFIRFWVIEVESRCIRVLYVKIGILVTNFGFFFDHVPYIPYQEGTRKVNTDPKFNFF